MKKIDELSKYLKVLADPTRLKILDLLNSGKPLCVNAISHRLSLTQPAISQHLKILKQMNIVTGNRMGYHIHYSVNKEEIKKIKELFSGTL